jgi:hypothetical protein
MIDRMRSFSKFLPASRKKRSFGFPDHARCRRSRCDVGDSAYPGVPIHRHSSPRIAGDWRLIPGDPSSRGSWLALCSGVPITRDHAAITRDLSRRSRGSRRFAGAAPFFQSLCYKQSYLADFDPWVTPRFPLGHPEFSTGSPKLLLGSPKHQICHQKAAFVVVFG